MEQRAPLEGLVGNGGAPPIVTDRGELLEVAGEQKLYAGPVELGDLIQEPNIHLADLVDPQDIARGRAV
jgi:hypothetical protein